MSRTSRMTAGGGLLREYKVDSSTGPGRAPWKHCLPLLLNAQEMVVLLRATSSQTLNDMLSSRMLTE